MDRREFFLKGLKAGACKKREWVLNLFFEVQPGQPRDTSKDYPYRIVQLEDGAWYVDPENNNQLSKITGYPLGESIFWWLEAFRLDPGDLDNFKGPEPIITTPGNVFVNQLVLCIPFGATIPFMAGLFDTKKSDRVITDLLTDDPEDDNVLPAPNQIFVKQYLQYCDHALSLVAFAPGSVTTVSKRSLKGHPDRDKVLAELKEKFKGRLDDPAVIAEIGGIFSKMDHEWLKDDPTYQFYLSKVDKLLNSARKKQFYMFGGESPFQDGTSVQFISKSLEEGIDTNNLPVLFNSLRYGSYNRGKQTALGGESTKTIYRMVGVARIVEDDCGTTIGVPREITKASAKRWVGFCYLENGKSILITSENADALVGRTVMIRGPMTCKTGRGENANEPGRGKNICKVCAGKDLGEQPDGLPAACAGVGGKFLKVFLKKTHSSALKTTKWDYTRMIS